MGLEDYRMILVEEGVTGSLWRIENAADKNEERDAELAAGPLLAAIEEAFLDNNVLIRYFGADSDKLEAFATKMVWKLEKRYGVEGGQTWCDECTKWHPLTPHNPAALW